MGNFTRSGFGQVEPNQLSAQKTGQIYASLPVDKDVKILQQGTFMKYDAAKGMITATGAGEWMLVYNEIKLYEDFWRTSYKDFALIRVGDNYVTSKAATAGYGDGAETEGTAVSHSDYPYRVDGFSARLFKTNSGDLYTTNMVKTGVAYAVGDILAPVEVVDANSDAYKTGVLEKTVETTGMLWQVAKVYTMPDGQPGLKLQRIQ